MIRKTKSCVFYYLLLFSPSHTYCPVSCSLYVIFFLFTFTCFNRVCLVRFLKQQWSYKMYSVNTYPLFLDKLLTARESVSRIAIHKTMAFLLCCDDNSSPCWWPQQGRLFHTCNFSLLRFQRSLSNIYHQKPSFSTMTLCSSPPSWGLTRWWKPAENAAVPIDWAWRETLKECEMSKEKLGWNPAIQRGSEKGLKF